MTYKKDILTVVDNNVVLGFISRRRNIFGEHEWGHHWCVMRHGSKGFGGCFVNRKQARQALEG